MIHVQEIVGELARKDGEKKSTGCFADVAKRVRNVALAERRRTWLGLNRLVTDSELKEPF
jgi:hypothetical protein